jgi:hypothetical protein
MKIETELIKVRFNTSLQHLAEEHREVEIVFKVESVTQGILVDGGNMQILVPYRDFSESRIQRGIFIASYIKWIPFFESRLGLNHVWRSSDLVFIDEEKRSLGQQTK